MLVAVGTDTEIVCPVRDHEDAEAMLEWSIDDEDVSLYRVVIPEGQWIPCADAEPGEDEDSDALYFDCGGGFPFETRTWERALAYAPGLIREKLDDPNEHNKKHNYYIYEDWGPYLRGGGF